MVWRMRGLICGLALAGCEEGPVGAKSTPIEPVPDSGWSSASPDAPGTDTDTDSAPEDIATMLASIDRTVDPDFVYAYDRAAFVPPDGHTLLIMGQTVERIDEYTRTFPDELPPAGWSAYWGVPEFAGITEPKTDGYGTTHDHQMLVDDFPDAVVHSAMWMVGTWGVAQNTANGDYDAVIDQYAAWAKTVNRPIYLRIGYEFDGIHNELDPDEYVAAYRRVVDRMRAAGVTNVAYVWHSYASTPYGGHPVSAWYPGDDYVDWVGVSVFGHVYSGPSLGADGEAVLAFARDHSKPVMAAESSAVKGISPTDTAAWDDWFVPYFTFVHRYNIKAICFITEDWSVLDFPGVTWEDARLTTNPTIAAAWFAETDRERYLHASPELYGLLGYPASE